MEDEESNKNEIQEQTQETVQQNPIQIPQKIEPVTQVYAPIIVSTIEPKMENPYKENLIKE